NNSVTGVIEVPVPEENRFGSKLANLRHGGRDVSAVGAPWNPRVEQDNGPAQRRGETRASEPGQDHPVAAYRAGRRVDIVRAEEAGARGDHAFVRIRDGPTRCRDEAGAD